MKKVIILALSLSMISASCGLFGASGAQGVLKSDDGGQTYNEANAVDPEGSISGVNVNVMTMDPFNSDVLYIGSSNGIHKTDNGADSWKYLLTGIRIGDVAIDPADSNIVFASGINNNNGRIVKSVDGGNTWKDVYTEPTVNNAVLTVVVSIANSQNILAGLNNGEIVRSTDGGATWQSIKDFGAAVLDIEFIDPGTAYALTQSSGLHVTTDQGATWTPVPSVIKSASTTTSTQIQPAYLSTSQQVFNDVAFDKRTAGTIYMAAQQGLMKSADSGKTWSIINIPAMNQTLPVSAVTIDPTNSNNVIIAVGSTIFKTNNGGSTWDTTKLNSEQRVRHIIVDPLGTNIIYLGMGEQN